MSDYQKYHCFIEHLAEKAHDLANDVLKVALTNVPPNLASHVWLADIGELPGMNGYVAGGNQALQASSGQSGGIYSLALNDPATWVAVGGAIGPFRYAVLYNASADGGPLIAAWDYGQSITLQAGETFRADFADQVLAMS